MGIERIVLRTETIEECHRLIVSTSFARHYLQRNSPTSFKQLSVLLHLDGFSGFDLESVLLYFAASIQVEPHGVFTESEPAINAALPGASRILQETLYASVPYPPLRAAIILAVGTLRELIGGLNGRYLTLRVVRS